MALEGTEYGTVVELAAIVRARVASPQELVEAALRRAESLDGTLNAFVGLDGDRALAEAARVEPGEGAPWAGVPIAVKANTPVAGFSLTHGSALLAGHRATGDAFLVSRLREAGFVVIGVTTMPEFGLLPTTEPRAHGPARNPWDPERTPGGSSGGSAAAVASGTVALAHGNDGGGSLRIPAACCGLVGLKPSRGRISRGPDQGDSFLAVDGALTRTIADAALALDVLAGYEVGDPTWAPRPTEPYVHAMRRDPGRLRVAVSTANPLGVEPDPVSRRALEDAAALLTELGHDVRAADPPMPGPEGMGMFVGTFGPAVATGVLWASRVAGREPGEADLEPLTRAVVERARATSAVDYLAIVSQLQARARRMVAFFAEHDLLLTPALAERPLAIGACTGTGTDVWEDFARSGRFTPYTSIFNVTGQPALTLPMGIAPEDGLPVAVQLVGKPLAEDVLLAVGTAVEAARPWAHERPSLG